VFGINNSGQVVVSADLGPTTHNNYLYDSRKRSFTLLPPYSNPASLSASLLGINEPGVTVGSWNDGTSESGLIRSKQGAYTSFSHPDCDDTFGRAISTTGLVSGFATGCTTPDSIGFIYDPARDTFVDFLPSTDPNRPTIAQGITAQGQVVGSFFLVGPPAQAGNGTYAFLRNTNGTITFFRVNSSPTRARGITDSGRIVGFISNAQGNHGFVGSLAGLPASGQNITDVELLDVPSSWARPGYVITSTFAQGINNAGVIVGAWSECLATVAADPLGDCGDPANGRSHGFIATPIPPKKK